VINRAALVLSAVYSFEAEERPLVACALPSAGKSETDAVGRKLFQHFLPDLLDSYLLYKAEVYRFKRDGGVLQDIASEALVDFLVVRLLFRLLYSADYYLQGLMIGLNPEAYLRLLNARWERVLEDDLSKESEVKSVRRAKKKLVESKS